MSGDGPIDLTKIDLSKIPDDIFIDSILNVELIPAPLCEQVVHEIEKVPEPTTSRPTAPTLPLNQTMNNLTAQVLPLKPILPDRQRIKPSAQMKQRIKPAAHQQPAAITSTEPMKEPATVLAKAAELPLQVQAISKNPMLESTTVAKAAKQAPKQVPSEITPKNHKSFNAMSLMNLMAVKESAALDAQQDVEKGIKNAASALKKEARVKFAEYADLYLSLYDQFYNAALEVKNAAMDEKFLTKRKTQRDLALTKMAQQNKIQEKQTQEDKSTATVHEKGLKIRKSINQRIGAIRQNMSNSVKGYFSLLQKKEKTKLERKIGTLEKSMSSVHKDNQALKKGNIALKKELNALKDQLEALNNQSKKLSKDKTSLKKPKKSRIANAKPIAPSIKPAPVAAKPAPVAAKSAPVAAKPAPVAAKPAPLAAKPAPVAAKPASAAGPIAISNASDALVTLTNPASLAITPARLLMSEREAVLLALAKRKEKSSEPTTTPQCR